MNGETSQQLPAHRYLRHVDGLRAVAVLSVIAYHLGFAFAPGGYVGVDVFFVISGFLITRLILSEIAATARFNFARFYIRRMRRLFPALAVTLLASFAVAAVLLAPAPFDRFGESLVAAVLSVSNILFWKDAGYFDASAHMKPLLHTWSLSVEEQFYLVWPALLWLLAVRFRSGAAAMAAALAVTGVASFALNHVWVTGNFDAGFRYSIFYLTPFRVFEFAAGALGVFAVERMRGRAVLADLLMTAGLALIAYGVLAFKDSAVFPYWRGLVPTLGAFLVIVSGEARVTRVLLANPLAAGIGLISYSLYLVHWPLIVFYEYVTIRPLTLFERLALLAAAFALAVAMYRFIEQPFRRNAPGPGRALPQKPFVTASLGLVAATSLLGAAVAAQDGWPWRKPGALDVKTIEAGQWQRYAHNSGCNLLTLPDANVCRPDAPTQVLILGNSHEADGYNAFAALYGANAQVNLISFNSLNGCDVRMEQGRAVSTAGWGDCIARTQKLHDRAFVSKLAAVVLSVQRPFAASNATAWQILEGMKAINPNLALVVMGGYLDTTLDCAELFNRSHTFATCKAPQFVRFTPFRERAGTRIAAARTLPYLYIDKAAMLCPAGDLASCAIEANGEPFTYDQHHLSFGFATFLGYKMGLRYGAALHEMGFPRPAGTAPDAVRAD